MKIHRVFLKLKCWKSALWFLKLAYPLMKKWSKSQAQWSIRAASSAYGLRDWLSHTFSLSLYTTDVYFTIMFIFLTASYESRNNISIMDFLIRTWFSITSFFEYVSYLRFQHDISILCWRTMYVRMHMLWIRYKYF